MAINYIFFFLINIFLINEIFTEDILTIKFHKSLPNLTGLSPKEITDKIKDCELTSEINIGTPSQKIELKLALTEFIFYVGGKDSLCKNHFIETESNTYQKLSDSIHFYATSVREGISSSDLFYFDKNLKEKKNIDFILATNTDKIPEGGIIGLNFGDEETKYYSQYNFINILKKKGYIKDFYFTIKYNDNNSGNIIIGDLPHNYDESYNSKYYKDMYISMFTNVLTWNINLDSVYVSDNSNSENKKIVGEKIYGYFKTELGIILGTERYKQFLLSDFMEERINKGQCFEIKSNFYISYYCKEEVDLTKLKNLYIYIKGLDYTFEFSYKDLFYKCDDGNNYFLIYFNIIYEDDEGSGFFWTLGEPFFKKYNLVFNQDTKRIGLYTQKNLNNNEDNQENKTFWQKNKWYIILAIGLVVVCCFLAIMIYLYVKVLPKRRQKANELDDGFDYVSKDNYIINNN